MPQEGGAAFDQFLKTAEPMKVVEYLQGRIARKLKPIQGAIKVNEKKTLSSGSTY